MTLLRYPGNPILSANSGNDWEKGSVLNPSVLYENGLFRMIYRATNGTETGSRGGYMSSVGYAHSHDGVHFTRADKPLIVADQPFENYMGCEDARVTKIDDMYFLYYTAVAGGPDEYFVRIALATSVDFKNWKKHGIVGPDTWSKAACLFPEKINGEYVLLYTWMADNPVSSIMQARFATVSDIMNPPPGLIAHTLSSYDDNVVIAPPLGVFRGAEVGAVPIRTPIGWLFIYCGANTSDRPEWGISAALLDLDDPRRILGNKEIMRPETDSEINGIVNNVTFPQGAIIVGDKLFVYYGSGDQGVCLATCNVAELLQELRG